jgi:DNA-binding NarL/FixJ family response regulator
MRPHGVILAYEPRLVREMLRRVICKTSTLEIVAEVTDLAQLLPVVEETDAQCVITSLSADGEAPDVVESLLAVHPSVCVLAVANDGSQAKIKCADASKRAADSPWLDALVAVLHQLSA